MRPRRSKPTQSTPAASAGPAGSSSRWPIAAAAILIALAAIAAYGNSLAGPFIFDDVFWINDNPSIRHLWPIWPVLFPPNAAECGGRPVVSLSLAINYALGGANVWGYHATNLAIHILAAWLLLGIVRRTLLLPCLRENFGSAAAWLALLAALLWMIHPLQTEAVTYVIQRTEALVGLFYLLVLYCVIRGATAHRSAPWYVAATAASVLGMATKEVMVTVPVIVLLYDRAFLAGSFREAWRRRYGLYLALASMWAVVATLLISTGFHGGTTGFGVQNFTCWSYLLTQPGVLVRYLRLTVWPTDLCLDYSWPAARTLSEILLPGILIVGLLGLTVWALVKRPRWGFLGAWFFVILAPTSSFVPIKDAAFEHRMYLPLAALATTVVLAGYLAGGWLVRRRMISPLRSQVIGVFLVMFAVIALAAVTYRRNVDFRSEVSICEDTVAKRPDNVRARKNLSMRLMTCGRLDDAVFHLRKAVEIQPDNSENHQVLASALAECNRHVEAQVHYRRALELDPNNAQAHNDFAAELANTGHIDEALAHFREVLRIRPELAGVHYNLGMILMARNQFDDAIACFRKALEVDPSLSDARDQLDAALRAKQQAQLVPLPNR